MSATASQPDTHTRRHVFIHWVMEFLLLFTATAILGAISGILIAYDGSFLSDWKFPINLNTFIAFLGTIFRACIAVILAEVIGQSKWSRFRDKPRPLKELQVYDEASRGAIGCFQLLKISFKHLRGNSLALSAAIALTLSFATGSFVQQAVATVECPKRTRTPDAFVKLSRSMPSMPFSQITGAELIPNEISAVINGLLNTNTQDTYGVSGCSTSDCIFPEPHDIPHTTVGVCSRCMDTTELVETSPLGTWSSSSNDNFADLLAEDGMPRLTVWGIDFELPYSDAILEKMDEEMLKVAQIGFVNVTLLAGKPRSCVSKTDCNLFNGNEGKGEKGVAYVGAMCSLYPCVQEFEAEIRNNTLDIRDISTTLIPLNHPQTQNALGVPWLHERDFVVKSPCVIDGEVYGFGNFSQVAGTSDPFNNLNLTEETKRTLVDVDINGHSTLVPADCFYNVDPQWRHKFSLHLNNTVFSADCMDHEGRGGGLKCDGGNWWLSNLWDYTQPPAFEHFEGKFEDLARSLTNYFRAVGTEGRTANPEKVVGYTDEVTFCVHFDWPFLLFPAVLYLITLGVLIATLAMNYMDKRQHVWKTDILPLLFFGLQRIKDGEQSSHGPQSEDIRDIDKTAKSMPVILQDSATTGATTFLEVERDQVVHRKTSYSSQFNQNTETDVGERSFSRKSQVYYSVPRHETPYEGGRQFEAHVLQTQAHRGRRLSKTRPGEVEYRTLGF